ncbi:MAG: 50S ribosomal protein L1 [Candidatus Cloacimonetes bacterium]|nr:50S ribosomal protein L1 [Candidatus Cloacimonadota bacterium]
MKRGKRYRKALELIDRDERYTLDDAISILKKIPASKFDETVEIHLNLGVDPRKADQQIRNSVLLPNGTGKDVRVLVFAEGDKADEATAAGADYVGVDEFVTKIQGGWLDFDLVVSTPNLMGKIGRLGRVLGPRGLMPNPKVGTVTMDVGAAVKDAKFGKVAYRVDKFSNLHIPAGKISFDADKIKGNIIAIMAAVLRDRPAAVKGQYIKTLAITTTMGPSVKCNIVAASLESKR